MAAISKEDAKREATQHLAAHASALHDLHHKLGALQESHDAAGKEHLKHAVEKYKKAHETFVDDVLACVPSR
jgi:hypothetical protein